MSQFIAKKIARNVLKEHSGNQNGAADPYFEYVAATDMNGNVTGRPTKRKRAVPPGLTKSEEKVLKKVTRRAYRLDNAFNFCGIRVGIGAIIGFIPVIGDFADTILALMVMRTCLAARLPKAVQSKMLFNIVLDFLIGLVPLLGDVGDMLWRANTKNAALLYETLERRGAERLRRGELPTDDIKDERHRPTPAQGAVEGEGVMGGATELREHPNAVRKTQLQMQPDMQQPNAHKPQPARNKTGGLAAFSPFPSRTRDADVENAEGGYDQDCGPARQETGRTGRR